MTKHIFECWIHKRSDMHKLMLFREQFSECRYGVALDINGNWNRMVRMTLFELIKNGFKKVH